MWHWPRPLGRVSKMPALAPRCRSRKHLRCHPRTPERIAMEWFRSENIGGIPRYVAQVNAFSSRFGSHRVTHTLSGVHPPPTWAIRSFPSTKMVDGTAN